MIDPARVCLFIPSELRKFKRDLFERIGRHIRHHGGRTVHGDYDALNALPDDIIPIIGASPELRRLFVPWQKRKRTFIYWDRGYARRVFATWLPRGENGGYYRWHVNAFQMRTIRNVPADRWNALQTPVTPWRKGGRHIVIAQPTPTYIASHGIAGWTEETMARLRGLTDRYIILRDKESKRPLQEDLENAHCVVAHGSIAAVESVIMGTPVFVHPDSAASLVGETDLAKIESPLYPDRTRWLHSLAYHQANETELCDGTLWRVIL